MYLINVLKYKDLALIETFFRNAGYDNGNIEVVMYLETQERLNALNKEFFYEVNDKTTPYEECVVPELTVNIGNVRFIYRVKKKNEDSE